MLHQVLLSLICVITFSLYPANPPRAVLIAPNAVNAAADSTAAADQKMVAAVDQKSSDAEGKSKSESQGDGVSVEDGSDVMLRFYARHYKAFDIDKNGQWVLKPISELYQQFEMDMKTIGQSNESAGHLDPYYRAVSLVVHWKVLIDSNDQYESAIDNLKNRYSQLPSDLLEKTFLMAACAGNWDPDYVRVYMQMHSCLVNTQIKTAIEPTYIPNDLWNIIDRYAAGFSIDMYSKYYQPWECINLCNVVACTGLSERRNIEWCRSLSLCGKSVPGDQVMVLDHIEGRHFEKLKALKNLQLNGHDLTDFPGEIFLHCPELCHLGLACNNIRSFSDAFYAGLAISKITTLDLRRNPLTDGTKDRLQEITRDLQVQRQKEWDEIQKKKCEQLAQMAVGPERARLEKEIKEAKPPKVIIATGNN